MKKPHRLLIYGVLMFIYMLLFASSLFNGINHNNITISIASTIIYAIAVGITIKIIFKKESKIIINDKYIFYFDYYITSQVSILFGLTIATLLFNQFTYGFYILIPFVLLLVASLLHYTFYKSPFREKIRKNRKMAKRKAVING